MVFISKLFHLKCLLLSVLVRVDGMEGEDISQGVFGRFSTVLYAMMIILVREIFRWLVNNISYVAVPEFNRQMVENVELMVRLALKDQRRSSEQAPGIYVQPPQPGEDAGTGEKHHNQEKRMDREKQYLGTKNHMPRREEERKVTAQEGRLKGVTAQEERMRETLTESG